MSGTTLWGDALESTVDASVIEAYLRRIGTGGGHAPDAGYLRSLQERHLLTVPFENIDVHLGVPIRIGAAAVAKVAVGSRGGTCRELNGSAFPALLTALGYAPTLLGSQVFVDGKVNFPLAHTVIRVDCPDPWFVDVGFGRDAPRFPLRLDVRGPQNDPNGVYEFVDAPYGDVDLLRDGLPMLRIDPRPRTLTDFAPALWWFETAPDSPFRTNLFCTRLTVDGRITLRGNHLTSTAGTERSSQILTTDEALRRAYADHFDITLDRLPSLENTDA
ncbi:arylamine N-acetyltransferase family protein [Actinokineospora terrae]|uniref:N-hydroxyarylamine O-acetyltransferase n=1 Tax=Actinokineospora terrae TaxID=155974 RepID=A0A1H9XQM3_9PSEU|nr:arylamine N-acetyltransferase [Actinokineospora terrae]SES47993.1 N-hydroxyarylamine O-acetyltransferase [Actinokineospora terrae]